MKTATRAFFQQWRVVESAAEKRTKPILDSAQLGDELSFPNSSGSTLPSNGKAVLLVALLPSLWGLPCFAGSFLPHHEVSDHSTLRLKSHLL